MHFIEHLGDQKNKLPKKVHVDYPDNGGDLVDIEKSSA
jgi:hypothetical protein